MKKILCLMFFVSFVLVGCGNDLEKDNQSNIVDKKSQDIKEDNTQNNIVNEKTIDDFNEEFSRSIYGSALDKLWERLKIDYESSDIEFEQVFNYQSATIAPVIRQGNYVLTLTEGCGAAFEYPADCSLIIKRNNTVIDKRSVVGKIIGIYKVKTNNSINYVSIIWSGGAHCCYNWQFVTYEDEVLKLGDKIEFGNSGEMIFKDNFFVKDGQLYFRNYDDRFAYFDVCYASSCYMFAPKFYRLDAGARISEVSNEFTKYYKLIADQADSDIHTLKEKHMVTDQEIDSYDEEFLLPPLVFRAFVRYLELGDKDEIWDKLKQDFNYFFSEGGKEKAQRVKEICLDFK